MYLEAALEENSCSCPSPHLGLWMQHPSAPFDTHINALQACRSSDSSECKTNLCTFLAWLNVPQIFDPVLSPLWVIFLQYLLLLLCFFPITISQQKNTCLPSNIFKRDTQIISACKPSISVETTPAVKCTQSKIHSCKESSCTLVGFVSIVLKGDIPTPLRQKLIHSGSALNTWKSFPSVLAEMGFPVSKAVGFLLWMQRPSFFYLLQEKKKSQKINLVDEIMKEKLSKGNCKVYFLPFFKLHEEALWNTSGRTQKWQFSVKPEAQLVCVSSPQAVLC